MGDFLFHAGLFDQVHQLLAHGDLPFVNRFAAKGTIPRAEKGVRTIFWPTGTAVGRILRQKTVLTPFSS
jgi:hypothetical protein